MTSENKREERKGTRGRPRIPSYMRRKNFTVKLAQWLQDWLRDNTASQGAAIEEALTAHFGLEPPQADDYLTTGDKETGAFYLAQDPLPAGAELLGTVTRPKYRSGALVRLENGELILYLAGQRRFIPPDVKLPTAEEMIILKD